MTGICLYNKGSLTRTSSARRCSALLATALTTGIALQPSASEQTEALLPEWQVTYAPSPGAHARAVAAAPDGDWIVAGNIEPLGASSEGHVFLLRLNATGSITWEKQLVSKTREYVDSVGVAADGACAIAGFERVVTTEVDGFFPLLLGTDVNGDTTWRAAVLEDGNQGYLSDVTGDGDGDGWLAVGALTRAAGQATESLLVSRVDRIGKVLWRKQPGTLQLSRGRAAEVVEGGYIVAGAASRTNGGALLAYLLRLDTRGELVWEKTYQWQNSFYNEAFAVLPTAMGYFVVGGTIPFFDSTPGLYLLVMEKEGGLASQSTLPGSNDPSITTFARSPHGGFVLASGDSDHFRVRSLGDTGSVTSQYDLGSGQPFGAAEGVDGGYVVVGKSILGARIVKLAPERDFLRGDSNSDRLVDMSDAVSLLGWLFGGGPKPLCADAADMNDDASVNVADALRLLAFLFVGAAPLPPPFPQPGPDATPKLLGCGSSTVAAP